MGIDLTGCLATLSPRNHVFRACRLSKYSWNGSARFGIGCNIYGSRWQFRGQITGECHFSRRNVQINCDYWTRVSRARMSSIWMAFCVSCHWIWVLRVRGDLVPPRLLPEEARCSWGGALSPATKRQPTNAVRVSVLESGPDVRKSCITGGLGRKWDCAVLMRYARFQELFSSFAADGLRDGTSGGESAANGAEGYR